MSVLKLEISDEPLIRYLQASAEATGRTVEQVAIQAIKNGPPAGQRGSGGARR